MELSILIRIFNVNANQMAIGDDNNKLNKIKLKDKNKKFNTLELKKEKFSGFNNLNEKIKNTVKENDNKEKNLLNLTSNNVKNSNNTEDTDKEQPDDNNKPHNQNKPDKEKDNEDTPDKEKDNEDTPDKEKDDENKPDKEKDDEDTPDKEKDNEDTPDKEKDNEDTPDKKKDNEDTPDKEKDDENKLDKEKDDEDDDDKSGNDEDGDENLEINKNKQGNKKRKNNDIDEDDENDDENNKVDIKKKKKSSKNKPANNDEENDSSEEEDDNEYENESNLKIRKNGKKCIPSKTNKCNLIDSDYYSENISNNLIKFYSKSRDDDSNNNNDESNNKKSNSPLNVQIKSVNGNTYLSIRNDSLIMKKNAGSQFNIKNDSLGVLISTKGKSNNLYYLCIKKNKIKYCSSNELKKNKKKYRPNLYEHWSLANNGSGFLISSGSKCLRRFFNPSEGIYAIKLDMCPFKDGMDANYYFNIEPKQNNSNIRNNQLNKYSNSNDNNELNSNKSRNENNQMDSNGRKQHMQNSRNRRQGKRGRYNRGNNKKRRKNKYSKKSFDDDSSNYSSDEKRNRKRKKKQRSRLFRKNKRRGQSENCGIGFSNNQNNCYKIKRLPISNPSMNNCQPQSQQMTGLSVQNPSMNNCQPQSQQMTGLSVQNPSMNNCQPQPQQMTNYQPQPQQMTNYQPQPQQMGNNQTLSNCKPIYPCPTNINKSHNTPQYQQSRLLDEISEESNILSNSKIYNPLKIISKTLKNYSQKETPFPINKNGPITTLNKNRINPIQQTQKNISSNLKENLNKIIIDCRGLSLLECQKINYQSLK